MKKEEKEGLKYKLINLRNKLTSEYFLPSTTKIYNHLTQKGKSIINDEIVYFVVLRFTVHNHIALIVGVFSEKSLQKLGRCVGAR